MCDRKEPCVEPQAVLETLRQIDQLSVETGRVMSTLRTPIVHLQAVLETFPDREMKLDRPLDSLEKLEESLDKALCAHPACSLAPRGPARCCVAKEHLVLQQLTALQAQVRGIQTELRKGGFDEFSHKIVHLRDLCDKVLSVLSAESHDHQNHTVTVGIMIQVARDLTAKLLEPPEKRKKAEFVHLLNELRTLRLEVGIDELADHLQIVSQVSKGADDYGLEVMRKMQLDLTKLSDTAHEVYNVVRATYKCWIPCCAFPAEQVGLIEECAYDLIQTLLRPQDLAAFQQTCNMLVKLDTVSLSRDFQDVLQLCYGLDQLQEVTERVLGTSTFQFASTEHKDPVPVVVQPPRACCV